MSARLDRAARLVGLAKRSVDAAQGKLAGARRAAIETATARDRAEAAWSAAADELTRGSPIGRVSTVGDVERQGAHLQTLRQQADRRAVEVAKAAEEVVRCAHAILAATTEQRKLELWHGRLLAVEAEERGRLEQRADDEQAARIARRHP